MNTDIYKIEKTQLESKKEKTLERCFEEMNQVYEKHIDSAKNIDNKASLLLVVYVGIFTIFSCFLREWKFENVGTATVFIALFGLTVVSYIASIVCLILTICTRVSYTTSSKSVCLNGVNEHREWLIEQIIFKGKQCSQSIVKIKRKNNFYRVGSIVLLVSVLLTLLSAALIVYCNIKI
ncbi:MAG: hypothetical protein IJ506_01550 [Clostridia bacterium]|nr:hypothetical protein [Clostridia bacterium]